MSTNIFLGVTKYDSLGTTIVRVNTINPNTNSYEYLILDEDNALQLMDYLESILTNNKTDEKN